MMKTKIQSIIQDSIQLKKKLLETYLPIIEEIATTWIRCYQNNGKILFCGNGGSASDAQHIATELMVRLKHTSSNRPALPALALTTDTSLLTAAGNDLGFDEIFARQVEGLAQKNDILVAISTSGNSPNVVRAVEVANNLSLSVIGFLGNDGGILKSLIKKAVIVPHTDPGRIQEIHIMIGHILSELTEEHLYGQASPHRFC